MTLTGLNGGAHKDAQNLHSGNSHENVAWAYYAHVGKTNRFANFGLRIALHQNASGGLATPGPAGGAMVLSRPPVHYYTGRERKWLGMGIGKEGRGMTRD